MLPPASSVGPRKAVEEEYMCVLSPLDVFDKVAGLPPENQSFKVVFKIKITVVCVHRSPSIK